MKKGFITIATGKDLYYKLAYNLIKSYKYFCDDPVSFAILCDRENEYTKDFDDVIIFKEGARNSYLDKLSLGEYLPYDENIFIDADCLAFGDCLLALEPLAGKVVGVIALVDEIAVAAAFEEPLAAARIVADAREIVHVVHREDDALAHVEEFLQL